MGYEYLQYSLLDERIRVHHHTQLFQIGVCEFEGTDSCFVGLLVFVSSAMSSRAGGKMG